MRYAHRVNILGPFGELVYQLRTYRGKIVTVIPVVVTRPNLANPILIKAGPAAGGDAVEDPEVGDIRFLGG